MNALQDIVAAELPGAAGEWFLERVEAISAFVATSRHGFPKRDPSHANAVRAAYELVIADLEAVASRKVSVEYLRGRPARPDLDALRYRLRELDTASKVADIYWLPGLTKELKDSTVGDLCDALAIARDVPLHDLHLGRRLDKTEKPSGNLALIVAALKEVGIHEPVATTFDRVRRILGEAARDAGAPRRGRRKKSALPQTPVR